MIKTIYKNKKTTIVLKNSRITKTSSMSNSEPEIQKFAHSLGIAPEVFSYSNGVIEMEYIKGSELDAYIKKPDTDRKKLKRDVRAAINILYDNGIKHNDLTGKNVMIASDGAIKILDYGSSVMYKFPVPKNERYYGVLRNF